MIINNVEQLMIELARLDILDRRCDDTYIIRPDKKELAIEVECRPEIDVTVDPQHDENNVTIDIKAEIQDNYFDVDYVEYQKESEGFGEMLIIYTKGKQ